MRRSFALPLSLVALLAASPASPAGEQSHGSQPKPVVTLAFSGIAESVDDLNFIGSLSGNPQWGTVLEMNLRRLHGGRELATLDRSKPWGLLILTDGQQFSAQGFLPLGDIGELRDALAPAVAGIEEAADGRLAVSVEGQTLHLKSRNGWVYIGNSPESLDSLPEDPIASLDGLHEAYNLALRIHVQNVPGLLREYLLGAVQIGVRAGIEPMPGETSEQVAARSRMADRAFQQIKKMVNDLERVLLGVSFEEQSASLHLDCVIEARHGTETAARLTAARDRKSGFAGFVRPDAAVAFNSVGRIAATDVEQILPIVKELQARVVQELAGQNLSPTEEEAARRTIDNLGSVVVATIEQRDLDGGLLLLADEERATCLAGMRLSETDRLEAALKAVVAETTKSQRGWGEAVELDIAKHAGVRFHKLTVPLGDRKDQTGARPFGGELEIVLGIGENAGYLCLGSDAAETLARAIDDSASGLSADRPPTTLAISAGPIARFVARIAPLESTQMQARAIAAMLAGAEGKDRITLTTTIIENGQQVRIEMEQGLLRLLGVLPILLGPSAGIGEG